jgi:hypothetical protein
MRKTWLNIRDDHQQVLFTAAASLSNKGRFWQWLVLAG